MHHVHIPASMGLVCKGDDQLGPGKYTNAQHSVSKLPKANARYDFSHIEIVSGRRLGGGVTYVAGQQIKLPIIALGNIDSNIEVIVNYKSDKYWLLTEAWETNRQSAGSVLSNETRLRDTRSITRNLYTAPSQYVGRNLISGLYNEPLGEGLFCHTMIGPGVQFPNFIGEEINYKEMRQRTERGCGGYFISINQDLFLDCYENRFLGLCLSSCANAATTLFPVCHKTTKNLGEINVKIHKCYDRKKSI